ncbi:hypothetical protein [Methylomicrobium lacus]|uniref:hypothetical protein n=1 Tax=Methylomicrobium lacus TaxID=136992 RepID=UPI0012684AAE|nr:hypothetical protein [Methylomicrobium lacus]
MLKVSLTGKYDVIAAAEVQNSWSGLELMELLFSRSTRIRRRGLTEKAAMRRQKDTDEPWKKKSHERLTAQASFLWLGLLVCKA